jgi:hypothetical protein
MQIMSHHECKPVRSEGLQNSKNLNIAKSRDFLVPPQGIPRSPFNRALKSGEAKPFTTPEKLHSTGIISTKRGNQAETLAEDIYSGYNYPG